MPNIIASQSAVTGAPMDDLLASYAHYTGRAVARFASRAVAERRVADAIMSAADLAGRLGVPKGAPRPDVAPPSHADLVQRAADTGRADPGAMVAAARCAARQEAIETDEAVGVPAPADENGSCGNSEALPPHPASSRNPYPPGSLAARLWAEAEGEPPTPPHPTSHPTSHPADEPRPAPRPRKSSAPDAMVRAAGPGTASVRATSVRGAVLAAVVAAGADGVALSALAERFGADAARGCVGKLCATGHVVTFSNHH